MPSALRQDEKGIVRVIAVPVTFAEMADIAFREIRNYGKGDTRLMMRLMEVIGDVCACAARTNEQRDVLKQQAALALQVGRDFLPTDDARDQLEQRHRAAMRALDADRK
jgi:uncharacterized membrane protein